MTTEKVKALRKALCTSFALYVDFVGFADSVYEEDRDGETVVVLSWTDDNDGEQYTEVITESQLERATFTELPENGGDTTLQIPCEEANITLDVVFLRPYKPWR